MFLLALREQKPMERLHAEAAEPFQVHVFEGGQKEKTSLKNGGCAWLASFSVSV